MGESHGDTRKLSFKFEFPRNEKLSIRVNITNDINVL